MSAPPSCARWHAGRPSELRRQPSYLNEHGQLIKGKSWCALCARLAEAERRRARRRETFEAGRPYGVLPLPTWTPPERLMEALA